MRGEPLAASTSVGQVWPSGSGTDLMYAFTMNGGQVFSVEGQAIFPLPGSNIWQCLAILNIFSISDSGQRHLRSAQISWLCECCALQLSESD